MIRLVVFGLILSSSASSQFLSFASSADGSIFHFATNRALKGEALAITPVRIFRHADPPILQSLDVQTRLIYAPFVSEDGLTTGAYTYYPCFGSCMMASLRDGVQIQRNGKDYSFQSGSFRISRNGRFVLDSGFDSSISGIIHDLDTGTNLVLSKILQNQSAQAVSNVGEVLSFDYSVQAQLSGPGRATELFREEFPAQAGSLSAQGNNDFLLTELRPGRTIFRPFFRLVQIELATHKRSVLFEGYSELTGMIVSGDGRRLLLQSKNDLRLWDRSSGWRSLFAHDEGFRESMLTDNGDMVFARTNVNRVYRIDANTGDTQQMYAPFPTMLRQASGGSYPGSLLRFDVDYASQNQTLTEGATRFPTVKAEGRVFDVQVPWEATQLIGQNKIVELSSKDSPFVLRSTVQFAEMTGTWAFVSGPGSNLTAAKDDFSLLITRENPAVAGSLIHFWVSGMGPLDRPVATGEKGPSDPPANPIQTVACSIVGENRVPDLRSLKVPTQIYAPNLIGIYQIDVEIPSDWPSGTAYVSCKGVSPYSSGGYVPIVSKP